MNVADARQLNPVSLAFLGDAVFTLYVREKLVEAHDMTSRGLHKLASGYVRAGAQAAMLDALAPVLTDEERELGRRARNCHTPTHAKNATQGEYKKATALECIFGFLKVTGESERLEQLMESAMRVIDGGNI